MNRILILLLITGAVSLNAQNTVDTVLTRDTLLSVTKNYKNGVLEEVYFHNTKGNKDSSYVKYTRHGKIYIQGQYKDGVPVGVWNYYSSDTAGYLVQTLNFDAHKETFVDPRSQHSLICGPRFFGGNFAMHEYVHHRITTDFTAEERAKLKGQRILAVFEVDSVKYTTYAVTIDDKSISWDTRVKMTRIVQEMPAWLPPVCKDGTKVWRHSVVFVF